jgi:hypothetical protein
VRGRPLAPNTVMGLQNGVVSTIYDKFNLGLGEDE